MDRVQAYARLRRELWDHMEAPDLVPLWLEALRLTNHDIDAASEVLHQLARDALVDEGLLWQALQNAGHPR